MRIGILGAGALGTAMARRLASQGHDMMLSFNRDVSSLVSIAMQARAQAGSPRDLAQHCDVIALTVPWAAVPDALAAAGSLAGTIVWDCTNPLLPDFSGLSLGTTTSAGEEVARLVPEARVVKGIPPMAALLGDRVPTIKGRPPGVFVAGNDAAARQVVAGLLAQLPAEVTDAGDLTAARFIEPAMMLLVRLAYGLGHGPRVTLHFEQEGVL